MAHLRLVKPEGEPSDGIPEPGARARAPLSQEADRAPSTGGASPSQFFDPELARMADTAARLFAIVRRIRNG